jgi:hypothetical protein
MRDDFPEKIKVIIAKRVNYLCSNPNCRNLTTGPSSDSDKAISIGVAAHISAASPGGLRYDPMITTEERTSANNGIWLCQSCSKLIDSDKGRYTSWRVVRNPAKK